MKENDLIIVFVTVPNEETGRKIATALVTEKIAACVNIIPAVQSVYVWQDKLEVTSELLLVIKSLRHRFSDLRERIQALHSYEVPEIVAISSSDVSEPYLDWVHQGIER